MATDDLTIERTEPGLVLEVKRLYLPFALRGKCPSCGEAFERNFNNNYLSYPTLGEAEEVSLWCPGCDHEWSVSLVLDVTLSFAAPAGTEDV